MEIFIDNLILFAQKSIVCGLDRGIYMFVPKRKRGWKIGLYLYYTKIEKNGVCKIIAFKY